jgi:hypothetical protein
MRTSFSRLARETSRACAVSAGEAKSVVMTALATASSDNSRILSIPRISISILAAGFSRACFRLLSLRQRQLSCQQWGRRPLISGLAARRGEVGQQKPYFSKVVGEEWQI